MVSLMLLTQNPQFFTILPDYWSYEDLDHVICVYASDYMTGTYFFSMIFQAPHVLTLG